MSMSSKIAFLFPGQGSQSKGMLDAFADIDVVARTLEEASDALGYDMAALIHEDPDGRLDRTAYTQPALLTVSVSLFRLWQQQGGPDPDDVAGHSLGEYSALVVAGALDFTEALKLVSFRGAAMEAAVPAGEGKMAAIIGLADEVVENLCHEASTNTEKVWPANYNCPGQLVVAGHTNAVDRLLTRAKENGAKRALPLNVSAPSHTPLMRPASEALQQKLERLQWRQPRFPLWSNVDASPHSDPLQIRDCLVRQLVSPVRWTRIIQRLEENGVRAAIEIGPGRVLSGLVRRTTKAISTYGTFSPEELEHSIRKLVEG